MSARGSAHAYMPPPVHCQYACGCAYVNVCLCVHACVRVERALESDVAASYPHNTARSQRYLELNAWSLIANDNTLKQVADATRHRMETRAEMVISLAPASTAASICLPDA